jgi:hypothetical protein
LQRSDAFLWLIAALIYGVGDTLTTYTNLAAGMRELNPLINWYTIIPLKILIFLTLYLISHKLPEKKLAPLILIAVGIIGILYNSVI